MPNVSESVISKQFCGRILLSSIMLAQERWQLGFKQIPVSQYDIFPEPYTFDNAIDLVQQGISEKVALVASFLSAFVTGFVVAYVRCWRLALAISAILPCVAIMGSVMNKAVSTYKLCVYLHRSHDVCSSNIFQAFLEANRGRRQPCGRSYLNHSHCSSLWYTVNIEWTVWQTS